MAKGDDIQERLILFAARVINLCDALPDTKAGKHIAGQLLRSGTSLAPNYAEARGAESRKDFIHKLKIAVKELNESVVWMQIILSADLKTKAQLSSLIDECTQLARILSVSIRTTRNKME